MDERPAGVRGMSLLSRLRSFAGDAWGALVVIFWVSFFLVSSYILAKVGGGEDTLWDEIGDFFIALVRAVTD